MVRNIFTSLNFLRGNYKVIPYKSLDEITAVDFHNIKYLNKIEIMDKRYSPNKKYLPKHLNNLNDWWLKLNDHYFKLIKDQKPKANLRKKSSEISLQYEINLMEQVINILSYIVLNKNLLPLSAYNGFITQTSSSVKKISSGLPKRENEDVYDWIERLRSYYDGLITRQNRSEKKEVRMPEFSDFYQEKAYLEMALEKDHISETIKMTEWVIYKNQAHVKMSKNG